MPYKIVIRGYLRDQNVAVIESYLKTLVEQLTKENVSRVTTHGVAKLDIDRLLGNN